MNVVRTIKYKGVAFEKWVLQMWQLMKVRFRLYNEDRLIKSKLTQKNVLTQSEREQVKAFYSPYFKPKLTSHQFYKEKTGVFCVNYVPDYIWYGYIDPYYNDWKLDKYIDNKCYYHRIFPNVKMPQLFYYRLNGFWFDGKDNIVSEQKVRKFLSESNENCFLKMADSLSGCGYGVTFFAPSENDISTLAHLLNSKDDMVIQGAISQHQKLSAINDSSVNTVRILSLLCKDGTVKVYSSVLRIGRRGKKVDNASSGGITCGICPNGRLKKFAYNQRGNRFEKHPDSGFVFDEAEIPSYEKAVEMVKGIAPTVPHFRLVSWDIAIGDDGEPIFIEMNPAYGELDFHQLNNGPIFGEDTEEVLEEVFGNRKK